MKAFFNRLPFITLKLGWVLGWMAWIFLDLLTFFIPFSESLPALEKGEMKKDYNANTTGGDSEDEEDPRTPTSVSSQGSQGYDSAGSDFVDIEGFSQITPLPDSSLPEISLQVSTFFTSN